MSDRIRVAMTMEQCWHRVPGGTAVAAIGMARALRDRPTVEVVGVAARHREPAPEEWTPPVAVRHLGLPRLALYESWHRLRRPQVEKATGPVDVIHATSFAIPPRSTTLVVTIHDLAFLHEPSHFTKRGLSFFRRGLQLTREEAGLIHCPSQATADDCIANGFEGSRIRVIPFGVTPVPYGDETIRETLARLDIAGPYVLWTGTIEPRKNLPRLLDAWRRADRKDETLVLVGPGGWGEDIEAQLDSADNVRTIGFVDGHTLGALYSGASLLCWPSLREGFGFPVLEAMIQGCPVVTSRGTSTEEIAGDAAVLVDPTDVDEIAGAIGAVLDDKAEAERLSERGRARAREFSWERTADMLSEIYTAGRELAA